MDEAYARTLVILNGLNSLMDLYRADSASEIQLAQICSTLRWINTYLDRDIICDIVREHQLSNSRAIIELLHNPAFVSQ